MTGETEHLLACLAEEGSEIAKEACKSIRFGLADKNPTIKDAPPQWRKIADEVNDLEAVIEMLRERGLLPFCSRNAIEEKKAKVLHYMGYARDAGALSRSNATPGTPTTTGGYEIPKEERL